MLQPLATCLRAFIILTCAPVMFVPFGRITWQDRAANPLRTGIAGPFRWFARSLWPTRLSSGLVTLAVGQPYECARGILSDL